VRVRPFSKSEVAKNCTEAVIRDNKGSVMVRGMGGGDAKKFYDFDQVRVCVCVCVFQIYI
jgi:hypothetical protein